MSLNTPFHSAPNALQQAFDQIESVVGREHMVLDSSKIIDLCKDTTPRTEQASAFVYPANAEEIQKILKIAHTYKIPIWPVSQGRNWGYGASSPARPGAIILNMSRMNKIHEVNTDLAYAVIEPGVTFRQLDRYLIDQNLPLWLDCTDGPPDGSVMGNSLERGIGETDYGDHFGNLCGMEVILPDGQIIHTGGGQKGNFRAWHTYKWGVGPYIEGLFSQANFGIVIKVGVWLRPKPACFVSCIFELRTETDYPQLIDGLRTLQMSGALASKVHLINRTATKAVAIEDFNNPDQTLDGYKLAPWSFAAGLYGSHAHVRASMRAMRKVLCPLGRLEFITPTKLRAVNLLTRFIRNTRHLPVFKEIGAFICKRILGKNLALLEVFPHVYSIEQGHPSDFFVRHAYLKSKVAKPRVGDANPARDNCGLIWIGPLVPMIGSESQALNDRVEALYKKYGFEMYVALMVANPRTAVVLYSVLYDKNNATESQNALQLYFDLGALTQELGYPQYRTGPLYMDKIFAHTPEFVAFCNTLKQAVDPQGILAPGKYGVG